MYDFCSWRFIWLDKPLGANYVTKTYPRAIMWERAVGFLFFATKKSRRASRRHSPHV